MLFKTTEEQKLNLNYYIIDMLSCGIDRAWVTKIEAIAKECQGTFDLIELFYYETDMSERKELLYAMEESVRDSKNPVHLCELGELDTIFDC